MPVIHGAPLPKVPVSSSQGIPPSGARTLNNRKAAPEEKKYSDYIRLEKMRNF